MNKEVRLERLKGIRNALRAKLLKSRLKNRNFTIISNECWGGSLYKELGLSYASPFIGSLIPGPCYMRLIKNLKWYMGSKLVFVGVSRYENLNKIRDRMKIRYPIGLLGEDVEVHFIHYRSSAEVLEKWTRRLARVNWDNIFIVFSEWISWSGSVGAELIKEFESFSYSHKICFTCNDYPQFKSTVWIKGVIVSPKIWFNVNVTQRYFDVVDWLNGGSGKFNPIGRIVNELLYGSLRNYRFRTKNRVDCQHY